MNFIYGFVAGIVVVTIVCLIWPKKKAGESKEKVVYQTEDETKKKENLVKIENYISDKEKFTNDDLEKLLGVSNTTVKRYLDELESAGKIKQIGQTGSGVYYTKAS